jgi:hypothetical protein
MNTTLDRATAYGYATQIKDILFEIADIANTYGDEITSEQLRDVVAEELVNDGELDDAAKAREAADLLDSYGIGDDNEGNTLWDRYINTSLEITQTATRCIGAQWDIDTVRMLITFGGPNCWIVAGHTTGVVIECHWASDSSTLSCPGLDDLGLILWEISSAI